MAKKKQPSRQDIIYTNVRKIISKQQAKSRAKFKVTMQERKKPLKDWITDTQEELVDTLLYLEKIKYDKEVRARTNLVARNRKKRANTLRLLQNY